MEHKKYPRVILKSHIRPEKRICAKCKKEIRWGGKYTTAIARGVYLCDPCWQVQRLTCKECRDVQSMNNVLTGQQIYRCYGQHKGGFEMKKDIGEKLPETSPEWCPYRPTNNQV